MKTKFLFLGFTAMSLIASAQKWNGPSTTNGDIYRDGNVGIGNTTTDPAVKLDVVFDAGASTVGSQWGVRSHITQVTSNNGGAPQPFVGLQGRAATDWPGQSYMYGVAATGYNGHVNWGGKFTGMGGNDLTETNYGVQASAYGNGLYCYGVWAEAGGCSNNWAGYFNGDVYRSGTDNFTSDRKLKNNIQPLTGSLEKIMKLKPSSYTFKRDEYMNMHLPKGKQMGLIAQDLEEVFPELVTNMPEVKMPDKDGKLEVMNPEFKSVQYISLIPVLIGGIQEQQNHINLQDQEIAGLKNEIAELKKTSTTGIGQLNTVETGFQMSQNEPNPFTHETLVKYTLPQSANSAFMAVYDLTGKQITTFPIEQKGSASLTITSEKLAAGIYLYSIVADGKVMDTKRMIVAEK